MITPDTVFEVITPDQVAETWDGVIKVEGLYEQLWDLVPRYDNTYRENIEDIGPGDVVGINCVKDFWDKIPEPMQIELNRLAKENE